MSATRTRVRRLPLGPWLALGKEASRVWTALGLELAALGWGFSIPKRRSERAER